MAPAGGDLERGGGEEYKREDKEDPGGEAAVLMRGAISTTSSSNNKRRGGVLEWNISELSIGGEGKAKTTLLRNIAGRAEAGQVLVIMGPSGAGKTSLIECLALRNRNFVGAVHLDGKSAMSDFFTKVAVVYQSDMLFGFMRVREHLTFHAITRMSKGYSRAQIDGRVSAVLDELGLNKCANTIIGGTEPKYLKKGISGGERKRLAIATELLLCPLVLFLDEPTSGLDSIMAESVLQSLRRLADHAGATIITSLHSPSSTLARNFTHMLFLTGDGRQAFQGRYQDVGTYLEQQLGVQVPKGEFTVDIFMDQLARHMHDSPDYTRQRRDKLASAFQASGYALAKPLPIENTHRQYKPVSGTYASSLTLLVLNTWRAYTSIWRDVVTYIMWTLGKGIVGLTFGVLYYQQAATSWRSMLGVTLLCSVASLFQVSMCMIVDFPTEWPKVVREYLSGANAIGPYMTSKFLYVFPYLPGDIIFSTIVFWMTGLGPDLTRYAVFVGILLLSHFASVSLGLLLASFSSNPLVGLLLSPIVLFPMVTLSGVLYQRSAVPAFLIWLQDISIINYTCYALLGTQTVVLPPAERNAVLRFTEVDPSGVNRCLLALVAITVVLYVLTYLNLRLRLLITKQSM